MKVLQTGSEGFLGSIIKKLLRDENFIFIDLNNKNSSDKSTKVDLSKEVPIILENNIDLVIHLAGKAHVNPKNFYEKRDFYNVNTKGTINLLKALEKSIPQKFVFISTVSVYGVKYGKNITEEFPLNATDAYGRSKILAEKYVQGWCKKHKVVCTILRLPLVIGENPKGNLKAMIMGIKKGFYFNIGRGEAKKSMVLAEDIAYFIPKVSNFGGVYNLTDGCHPSFNEFSKYLSLQLGKNEPFNIPYWIAFIIAYCLNFFNNSPLNLDKLQKITSDLTFDDSKARIEVGWSPKAIIGNYHI